MDTWNIVNIAGDILLFIFLGILAGFFVLILVIVLLKKIAELRADKWEISKKKVVKILKNHSEVISAAKNEVKEDIINQYHDLIIRNPNLSVSDDFLFSILCDSYSNKLISDSCNNNNSSVNLPFVAKIAANLKTLYLESKAQLLDWGDNKERRKKIESIRALRSETKKQLEKAELKAYQLEYLISLFPDLQEYIDSENGEIDCFQPAPDDSPEEYDVIRNYLSKEEYYKLSETTRNQLALDRYIERHRKSKWQIGRDYELYIGYLLEKDGWYVEYTGSELKLKDLGRDLIAHKNNKTWIIQCKYWSKEKTIHEKHIAQLFGTVTEYRLSRPLIPEENIVGVFVTSTTLSDMAHRFSDKLGIVVRENVDLNVFPRIKCNISNTGEKIYHLPMDLSYDSTKINRPGEFMAMTVSEAERAGFRRSYKWHDIEN